MTDYLENKVTDWLLRGQGYAPPSPMYVGLFTAAPSDTGGGTEVSTSGTNYARAGVTPSLANWSGTQSAGSTTASSGTGGLSSNNGAITFNTPSASWGTVTHFGIFDAVSGGNLLVWGALGASQAVGSGQVVQFNAGQLTITLA